MRTPSTLRALLAAAAALWSSHLSAAAPPVAAPTAAATPTAAVTLTEGVEYARLPGPEPAAKAKKIEILEVFSYGCVHCFHLEEALRAWKARLPADVELHYLPATFRPEFTLYARGFYAAQALGQLEATHAGVFDAIWNGHAQVRSLADLAGIYAGLGVDRARFIEAAQSADNRAAVDAAHEQVARLQVDGTPTFIVAGRYRVLGDLIDDSADLLRRVDAVIAMARAERRAGR
ncbi:MAG: thiol:disulfide interchange protein DsbA/DsbL [Steroidobacteraceae bacterium]